MYFVQATSNRTTFFPSSYSFPSVPWNLTTWAEEGLATRPTFFGCNESDVPLVIYLANGAPPRVDPVPLTNTSTTQDVYTTSEIAAMLAQAQEIATQGIPTGNDGGVDPEWPACLACAIVDRVRGRAGIARSGVCESCLDRYCWS
jgi:lysophospholipase